MLSQTPASFMNANNQWLYWICIFLVNMLPFHWSTWIRKQIKNSHVHLHQTSNIYICFGFFKVWFYSPSSSTQYTYSVELFSFIISKLVNTKYGQKKKTYKLQAHCVACNVCYLCKPFDVSSLTEDGKVKLKESWSYIIINRIAQSFMQRTQPIIGKILQRTCRTQASISGYHVSPETNVMI